MKYLLFFWGLHGPHVHAILSTEAACEALRATEQAQQHAAIVLCVPLSPNLVTDMVIYNGTNGNFSSNGVEQYGTIRVLNRSMENQSDDGTR